MKIERTLVVLKPDAIQRGLVGEIITRFEKPGLKLIGMKMVHVDRDFSSKHYGVLMERYGERIAGSSIDFMSSDPVIAMVWEGVGAAEKVRTIIGSTYPHQSPAGTIRGDMAHVSKDYANNQGIVVKNLIHGSAPDESPEDEVKHWFKDEELFNYSTVHETHILN